MKRASGPRPSIAAPAAAPAPVTSDDEEEEEEEEEDDSAVESNVMSAIVSCVTSVKIDAGVLVPRMKSSVNDNITRVSYADLSSNMPQLCHSFIAASHAAAAKEEGEEEEEEAEDGMIELGFLLLLFTLLPCCRLRMFKAASIGART